MPDDPKFPAKKPEGRIRRGLYERYGSAANPARTTVRHEYEASQNYSVPARMTLAPNVCPTWFGRRLTRPTRQPCGGRERAGRDWIMRYETLTMPANSVGRYKKGGAGYIRHSNKDRPIARTYFYLRQLVFPYRWGVPVLCVTQVTSLVFSSVSVRVCPSET